MNSSTRVATPSTLLNPTVNALEFLEIPPRPEGIIFPSLYSFFCNPWTPFVFSVVYFVTTKYLSRRADGVNRIQGKRWSAAVVAHNLFLAVYSAWTFLTTAPVIGAAFYRGFSADGFTGLAHAFCDSTLTIWAGNTFPRMCYLFYLSKFYEVIDTAIILAKGKKVGMLQSYHHAGAVWTMFAGFRSMSMPIWIFVVFNSFIHSLMYCYYVFSALKLPFPVVLKKNLTRLQITQFLIGGSLAASYLFVSIPSTLPSHLKESIGPLSNNFSTLEVAARERMALARAGQTCLTTSHQKGAVLLNIAYLIPLTYLFAAFFFSSYRKGAAAKVRSAGLKAGKALDGRRNSSSNVLKVE